MKTHAKIQKWGNSLALRISGIMREVPHLKEGSIVDIEVTEAGFTVTKPNRPNRFPYQEAELLKGLTPEKAHADLLALPLSHEIEQE